MKKNPIIHLVFMALGYIAAVLLAASITVFILFAPTVLPDNGAWGSIFKELKSLPVFLMFGAFYTFMLALPGWLISVTIAERQSERRKIWFAIAGLATAILAHVIARAFVGKMFAEPLTILGSLVGGFCGGLVYWAIKGKKSGEWKLSTKREEI